jgi:Flp pilus assembly protein TadB
VGGGSTLWPVAGDPLGEWRPSKDESLDEWAERQARARQAPEPERDHAVLVTRVACGVALAVFLVVWLILELL